MYIIGRLFSLPLVWIKLMPFFKISLVVHQQRFLHIKDFRNILVFSIYIWMYKLLWTIFIPNRFQCSIYIFSGGFLIVPIRLFYKIHLMHKSRNYCVTFYQIVQVIFMLVLNPPKFWGVTFRQKILFYVNILGFTLFLL